MPEPTLTALLQCPRCHRGPLRAAAAGHACTGCGAAFPLLDGIPWLFADPGLALGEWRNRLTLYLEDFAAAARAADADLALESRASTRDRLQRLLAAYREQQQLVAELLEPLALASAPLAQATQLGFATRMPLTQDLHSYYANLHRDWVWGEEENRGSYQLVTEALGGARTRVLVLGAGACRLAYDLHQASGQPLTVALDLNPLLLLAARRLLRGERVALYEFPLAPRGLAEVAIRRELGAPAPARPGLELVFADAWRAPFAAQSFDAVLTPWLVDIVDLDFESIALHINRLLAPGGRWVNFGSLAFPWRRPALRLSREEVAETVAASGFAVRETREARLPYMRSPASRHGRIEDVVVMAADKLRRAPREPSEVAEPTWLRDCSLPIPCSPELMLAADASRIQAVLLALIDGQRSVDELARIVSEQGLLPASQARSAVQGLLARLAADARRAAGA